MDNFHFIRPLWLLGLIVLFFVPWIKSNFIQKDNPWHKVADYILLNTLLQRTRVEKSRTLLRPILFFCWLVVIIALSGPSWNKVEVAGIDAKSNIVIVSEISPYMLATDIKPSRLERLKYKLYDLLEKTKDSNVAMIIFDNYPYILSPLTTDTGIIKNFVEVFDINMMPSPTGANMEKAMEKSLELLADYKKSSIIMLVASDGNNPSTALKLASQIKDKGHSLSIIAIGNSTPVPITNANGEFIKDKNGKTITATMDFDLLKNIATSSGGIFMKMTPDDTDINSILTNIATNIEKSETDIKISEWQDMGFYFVFIVLPFALLLFKRGFLVAIAVFFVSPAYAFDWESLWKNDNQQGIELFTKDPTAAAQKFTDKKYKGAAEYKSNQYDKALQSFMEAGDIYNAGNALAHLGKTDEAIKAYEKVIEQNPNHEDAKYNLEYLKKQQQQQQSHPQQQDQNQKQQQQEQSQNQQQQQNQGQDQQQQEQGQSQQQQQGQGQEQGQEQEQEQDKQSQSQNQQSGQPEWQLSQEPDGNEAEQKNDSESNANKKEKEQWMDAIERNPYGLLKNKLRLIYRKEYNNQ